MSNKLKLAIAAQMLTVAVLVAPMGAVMTNCELPYAEVGKKHCDPCAVQDQGGFWTWEVIGYECQNFGGTYAWIEEWYDSGASMFQMVAEEDCATAKDECEDWADDGNGGR